MLDEYNQEIIEELRKKYNKKQRNLKIIIYSIYACILLSVLLLMIIVPSVVIYLFLYTF